MTEVIKKKSNMNLPNIISIIRIALLPLIYFFYLADFVPYGKLISLCLFVLAAATDFLDGMIARKYNMVTDLGKLLDPMADKMLSFTGLVIIALSGVLPDWAICSTIFVILGRDFSVDCLRMVAATKGIVVAANWSGKVRTIVAMVAMPWLMLMNINNELLFLIGNVKLGFEITGYALIGIAVVLCAYSWFYYFYTNRTVFKAEEKTNKEAK